MDRLAWLTGLSLAPLLIGCTLPNPAFDDCSKPGQCAAEGSETSIEPGDGDGDSAEGNSADGDGDPGDGDGEPGDGDGDPGDGDGDPGSPVPACPDTAQFVLPVVEDTFLDGSGSGGNECLIHYDYTNNNHEIIVGSCAELDFGASAMHWVCGGGYCNSSWLGRFDVLAFAEVPGLTVLAAEFVFTAKVWLTEPASVWLMKLDVDSTVFDTCQDWMAGPGQGVPAGDCVTSFLYSAAPYTWNNLSPLQDSLDAALVSVDTPTSQLPDHHTFTMALENPSLVQDWMTGTIEHQGVILRGDSFEPADFNLQAQESMYPPQLRVTLCSEGG